MVIKVDYSVSPIYVNTDVSAIYIKVDYGTGGNGETIWGTITGTLSDQTDLQNALDDKVPYTGATGNVDLGEYELKAGQVEFDQSPTGTAGVGVMRWNDTDGTLDLGLKGGSVTLQVGEDIVARVVNKTGSNLLASQYKVVKVSSAQGQRLAVNFAQANNDNNSADTLGLVAENISNNQEGWIQILGQITEINTTGSLQGETWTDGDVLYLSPTTAGSLTNVKPVAPQHIVVLGYVEYAHSQHGKIYVKVMNGWELGELHDVDTTGATNGQALTYNSSLGIWQPSTISTNNIYNSNGTLTSNRTLTSGGYSLTFTGSNTASGAIARGLLLNHTLVAAANNDVLVGLDIAPTFTNGAFTGVSNFGIRSGGVGRFTVGGNNYIDINAGANGTTPFIDLFWSGTVVRRLSIANENTATAVPANSGLLFSSDGTTANAQPLIGANIVSTGVYGSLGGQLVLYGTGDNFIRMYQRGVAERGVMGYASGTSYFQIRVNGATNLTNGTLSTAFFSTGNVAIGSTTDAGFKLDVNGVLRATSDIRASGSGNAESVRINGASGGSIIFYNGALTDVFTINNLSQTWKSADNSNPYNATISFADNLSNVTNSLNIRIVPGQTSVGFGNVVLNHNGTTKKGNTLIGTSTNVASALLNVESTTQGFLQPRMTTTQRDAISTPATGLSIYNTTTNTIEFYNGTSWVSSDTGTGASGQIAYWTGTNTQAGSATLTYTPTSALLVNNSVTAATAIARGVNMTPTLTAAANNDVLVGLDIAPTFTNGAFTGVANYALRTSYGSDVLFASRYGIICNGDSAGVFFNTTRTFGILATANSGLSLRTGNSDNKFLIFGSTGNIAIGSTTDAGFKLDVSGNFRATGSVTAADIVLQNISGTRYLDVPATASLNFRIGTTVVGFFSTSRWSFTRGETQTTWALFENTVSGVYNLSQTSTQNGAQEFINIFGTTNNSNNNIGTTIRIYPGINNSLPGNLVLAYTGSVKRGNVLIGTGTNDASAIVNIESTTQGFLQPRMTTTQRDAISTPATGLSIYNTTTNTIDFYNGTSWVSSDTGTGASGQIAYWTGANTQAGSATLTYTPTSALLVNNSITAATAIARGVNMTPTLVAAANNDVLVGLDINPTFTNGAFTGVSNIGLRLNGNLLSVIANNLATTQDSTKGILLINNTAATGSVQIQYSPAIVYSSNAWNFSNNVPFSFRQYAAPYTNGTPFGQINTEFSVNNSAYTIVNRISSNGSISLVSTSALSDGNLIGATTPTLFASSVQLRHTSHLYTLGLVTGAGGSQIIAYTNGGASSMQTITFGYYNTTFSSQDITFSGGTTSSKYFGYSTGNWTIGGTTDAGFKLDVSGETRSQVYRTNFGTNSVNLLISSQTSQTSDRGIFIGGGTFNNGSVVSVAIGQAVTCGTGTGNVAIGYTANASGGSIAISSTGNSATASGGGVAIGANASATSGVAIKGTTSGSAYVGIMGSATNTNAIAIGGTASGSSSVVIGDRATVSHNQSVILGLFSISTASNQFIVGSNDGVGNGFINDVYFGSGVQRNGTSNGAGTAYTINGSGALGTDFAGGNITIAGGKGTGTGTPGAVIFSTSTALTTGTTLQSLTERARIDTTSLTLANAINIIVGTTTGTKIGTATSQKIGFWNATPIVQPTTAIAEAAFVENSGGTAVNVDSTFAGYTLQQIAQALKDAGLLA